MSRLRELRWFARRMATAVTVVAALGAATVAAPAAGQELKVAMSSPPNSMDPHFYNLFSNINVSEHIFESLIKMDADSRIIPSLAQSWKLIDNLTWEFKIRADAKFHDGSDVTADDVAWSLDRTSTIVNSPGKFDVYTKAVVKKVIVDPKTIRLVTATPYPLMLSDLTSIFVVSKKATEGLSSDDFSSGKGMVGSGPFKFVSFARDDRVELVRNDQYWGTKPAWSKVTLRFIPQPATRVAALLAKDVDAIENVPTADLKRIRDSKDLAFFSKVSHRVIYLNLDQREKTPFVTDKDGKPMEKNPFRDQRVRDAMTIAINREAIKDRVMEGLSEPTSNMVPATLFGHVPDLQVPKYDPNAAKKLLADAGYPNGFNLTLHGPNNRYVNDEPILQAIASMWTRIGVQTQVAASPMADFSSRVSIRRKEFSAWLLGWGAQTGEVSSPLRALTACENADKGFGTNNGMSYCNQQADALLEQGLAEVDDAKRLKLFQDAVRLVIKDAAFLPIHQQVTTWAARKGIDYVPRTDERTYAHNFKPI
jgi:peptide/nickel transport system substrate-binding protein